MRKPWNEIIEKLKQAPILITPDYSQPFVLETDASDVGIGAILGQYRGKKVMPIAYLSRALNGAERNYAPVEKECLAVVWAINKWRQYLHDNRYFTVITDNNALVYLKKKPIS